MRFAAGEKITHYNPIFTTPRRYPFEVFETRPQLPELYGVFPGELVADAKRDLVFIGLPVSRPMEGNSLEVIAVAPATEAPSPARITLPPPAVRAEHAAHLASLVAPAVGIPSAARPPPSVRADPLLSRP